MDVDWNTLESARPTLNLRGATKITIFPNYVVADYPTTQKSFPGSFTDQEVREAELATRSKGHRSGRPIMRLSGFRVGKTTPKTCEIVELSEKENHTQTEKFWSRFPHLK
jgi:hypothetical protein